MLGLVLAAALYAAVGVLASAIASSQLVAFLLALFFWLVLTLCCRLLPARAPAAAAEFLYSADPLRRLGDFTLGLLDSANVAYFVLPAAAALATATWVLRARRQA